jgi:hypothetical protein
MLATVTVQIPAANPARANAVASTMWCASRRACGDVAEGGTARSGPGARGRNPARQATISSRDATTAMAMPSSPGSSRPRTPRRAEPIWPLTRSSMRPATAAVMRMASRTQPRCAARRPARCHWSTTDRLSVRRAVAATAARPPMVATAAASQDVPGSPTGVPGRSRMCPSPAVIAQLGQHAHWQRHGEQDDRLAQAEGEAPPAATAAHLGQRHLGAAGLGRVRDDQEQQQPGQQEQLRGDQDHGHLDRPPAGPDRAESGRQRRGRRHAVLGQRRVEDQPSDRGLHPGHVGPGAMQQSPQ